MSPVATQEEAHGPLNEASSLVCIGEAGRRGFFCFGGYNCVTPSGLWGTMFIALL